MNPSPPLAGRSAIVTGGLTGIGLAIARRLAAEGANVAVGSYVSPVQGTDAARYPGEDEIAPARAELEQAGAKVHAGHLDVRDRASIAGFVRAAAAACGPADILVNAAGTTAEQPVCGHSDELWLKIIDTNLNGIFRMIRAALGPGDQHRLDRGLGRLEGQPGLLRVQGRRARAHALRGARRRAARRLLHRDQPDLGRDRPDAQERGADG